MTVTHQRRRSMLLATLTAGACALPLLLGALPAGAVERGGAITFARYDDSTLIDPVYADRNPDIWMVTNLYDTLLRTEADGKTIGPGLATGFTWAADHLSLTLPLRAGVKFSDGSAITAEDVKFSLDRARDASISAWANLLGSVTGVEAAGSSVVLRLKSPDPTLPSILATFATGILPKKAFEAAAGANDKEKAQAFYASGQIGSGPFVLKSHQRGTAMTLERNPHYWRQGSDGKALPYLDRVNFVVIPDDATRVLKLQAGEVDGAEYIPFARVKELKADPRLSMELFPASRITYMPVNVRETLPGGAKNPMADKRVRQALNYALNKKALLLLVNHGNGEPMTSMMPKTTQLHFGPTPLYGYDPKKARELLQAAGYDKGLEITVTTLAGSADDATLFTAIQQMWAAVGVTAKVEQVDGPTRGQKNRSGEFQIHTYGWTNDVNDPAQVTSWLGYYPLRKAVGTGWNNARFNSLYEASTTEVDVGKRGDLYKQMQMLYAEEAPLLFLYETPFAVALGKSVQGYVQSSLGNNDFSQAWKARAPSQ